MSEFKIIIHDGKKKPDGDFFWIRFRNGNDGAGPCRSQRWVWAEGSQNPYDIVEYSNT